VPGPQRHARRSEASTVTRRASRKQMLRCAPNDRDHTCRLLCSCATSACRSNLSWLIPPEGFIFQAVHWGAPQWRGLSWNGMSRPATPIIHHDNPIPAGSETLEGLARPILRGPLTSLPESDNFAASQAAEKPFGTVILRSRRRRRISYFHENAQGEILRYAQDDSWEAFFRSRFRRSKALPKLFVGS